VTQLLVGLMRLARGDDSFPHEGAVVILS